MSYYKLITVFLILSFTLVGCGNKLSEEDFISLNSNILKNSQQYCAKKGMNYSGVDYIDFSTVKVRCFTPSPYKIYEFEEQIK